MHRNSKLIFDKHARSYFEASSRVLEIGPDRAPSTYQGLAGPVAAWETVDLAEFNQGAPLTYFATDEYHFPVDDDQFDIVVSGQVIEHVRQVWVWMAELARVCKPGGLVITIAPLNWPYHEAPHDCWRIYPEGFRALHEGAGLETELATFERLDDGREGGLGRVALLNREARLLARRALGRPGWPLGAFKGEWAVDTVAVARKPSASSA